MERSPSDIVLRARYEDEGAAVSRYGAETYWDRRYHQIRFEAVAKHLTQIMRAEVQESFLDAGCGTGEYLGAALQLGADGVLGLDFALSYCRRARIHGGAVVQGSLLRLPFPNSSIDVVLCSEVVEHLPEQDVNEALAEIFRVARRHVLITTPNNGVLRRLARRVRPAFVDAMDESVGHISIFAIQELVERMPSNGWALTAANSIHVTPPLPQLAAALSAVPAAQRIIRALERAANRMAPSQGNISLVRFERVPPDRTPGLGYFQPG